MVFAFGSRDSWINPKREARSKASSVQLARGRFQSEILDVVAEKFRFSHFAIVRVMVSGDGGGVSGGDDAAANDGGRNRRLNNGETPFAAWLPLRLLSSSERERAGLRRVLLMPNAQFCVNKISMIMKHC